MPRLLILWVGLFLWSPIAHAQQEGREIDVLHYDLTLDPDPATKTLSGKVVIRFRYGKGSGAVHFQLDTALKVVGAPRYRRWDSAQVTGGKIIEMSRRGSQLLCELKPEPAAGTLAEVTIGFSGRPRVAKNPPWDGGLVWSASAGGKPWVGVACEDDGASIWWPCKDDWADEPDSGVTIHCRAPLGLAAVCNGSLLGVDTLPDRKATRWHWRVKSPINLYNVTFNIGNYACVRDSVSGPDGAVSTAVWLLKEDYAKGYAFLKSRIKSMMAGYQALFGAYPFRQDGYQLVQTAYWGMEHQSCIAYGNGFKADPFGYDFILIHESGHEWWGNQISVSDPGDLWVHEAFCTYGEALLVEREQGRQAMQLYLSGQRQKIKNQGPLQGPRGVRYHDWPDADIYYRGAGLLHAVNRMTGDSVRFIHCLQNILKRHTNRQASTESVLQIVSKDLGFEKAAYLRYGLNQRQVPVVELYKGRKGWVARLPGYVGPPVTLNGIVLDGTWRSQKSKPVFTEEWMVRTQVLAKMP